MLTVLLSQIRDDLLRLQFFVAYCVLYDLKYGLIFDVRLHHLQKNLADRRFYWLLPFSVLMSGYERPGDFDGKQII